SSGAWIAAIVLIVAAAAGGWLWTTRRAQIPPFDATPAHVMVKGTGEGKAVVALRFHLVTQMKLVQSECLAVIGHGYSNGYYRFDAVDSCRRTRLGRWKVDAITFTPSRT
ncbi:MAG TPA: hypothetical protein VJ853_08160, partial [Thermoanaerobaculia bacterium]|nr:hypothetical protein [Thermoanaerobaculia bacterium]